MSKPVSINGLYFSSTRMAGKHFGIDHTLITQRIRSRNFNEYKWAEYIKPLTKICGKCSAVKNIVEFKITKTGNQKRSSWCKKCHSIYTIANVNKEKVKINSFKYRHTINGRLQSKLNKVFRKQLVKESLKTLSIIDKKYIRWLHCKVSKMRKHGFDVHLDHITPLCKGGKHEPLNLQIVHGTDNAIKNKRNYKIEYAA